MERHIGMWFKESNPQKKEVAELIIDGNSVEFYSRFHGEVFPTTFIGNDGDRSYKVFVNGTARSINKRLLDYTSSHRVFYVLMQNFSFSKGTNISGVVEFSFSIPELINWLGIKTVFYTDTISGNLAAAEENLNPIIIHEANPHIEIYFETKTFEKSLANDDRTSITINQEPRISVKYDKSQGIETVMSDIECLMQFLGLLIGSVSTVDDIRLSIENQEVYSWLYFNKDFSYNTTNKSIIETPRTYLYIVLDKLQYYYSNWRNFFFDDTFALLRRIYFSVNNKSCIFAEEIFVEYMRILDGYHTRISGDEEAKTKLKNAINTVKKEIKNLLFTEEGKLLFEKTIKTVLPDWKCNSSHKDEIANWIASGFLSKTSLSHRLKEIDEQYLQIISNNAVSVENLRRDTTQIKDKSNEELVELYFKELSDTRNFYSHYKLDNSGVLEFGQILDSINILKATIVAILFKHMGIEKELIRKILAFDSELHFQTMFLRNEDDSPFEHPSSLQNKETDGKQKVSILNKIFKKNIFGKK
ncbi:MAG: hypothetical protein IKW03_01890 [Clostridia bacterium]|nr:hypothetical protein [Clostridia bacterium]